MKGKVVATVGGAVGMKYMPQLDALRAFAVGAVLVHHFIDTDTLPLGLKHLPWGFLGVRLFFVLSGFLITGILLGSRDAADSGTYTRWFAVRQFYIRRFLRIFPLYYIVVAALFVAGLSPVREIIGWLLTYTFNIQVSIQGWFPDHVSHFWTLSVEEQYYIFWPWIVLFAPRRFLLPISCFMICLGPVFRFYAVSTQMNEVATYCFTLSSLDTLGAGSLLAILHHRRDLQHSLRRNLTRLVLPPGVVMTTVLCALLLTQVDWKLYVIFLDTAAAMACSWLVYSASQGFSGTASRILTLRPLVYCGKITYGIYVYHLFMPTLLSPVFQQLGLEYPGRGLLNFAFASAATLLVASASWYWIEKPINQLKRHFRY